MTNAHCVFVVDDDLSARNGLSRLLRTASHDARDFGSVNEFLDALGSEVPGCVVLDAGVPGLSGEELRANLTACGVHLPIIAVAANDGPENQTKSRGDEGGGILS